MSRYGDETEGPVPHDAKRGLFDSGAAASLRYQASPEAPTFGNKIGSPPFTRAREYTPEAPLPSSRRSVNCIRNLHPRRHKVNYTALPFTMLPIPRPVNVHPITVSAIIPVE